MYYALIDTFARESNPGYGFANTKQVICFDSGNEREEYLENRQYFDYGCKKITRKQAINFIKSTYNPVNGDSPKGYYAVKIDKNSEMYDKFYLIQATSNN